MHSSVVHHLNLRLHSKTDRNYTHLCVALITQQQQDYCKALLLHNRYYFSLVDPQLNIKNQATVEVC